MVMERAKSVQLTIQAVGPLEIGASDPPADGIRTQVEGVVTAQLAGVARLSEAVRVAQEALGSVALLLALGLRGRGQRGVHSLHVRVGLLLVVAAGAAI